MPIIYMQIDMNTTFEGQQSLISSQWKSLNRLQLHGVRHLLQETPFVRLLPTTEQLQVMISKDTVANVKKNDISNKPTPDGPLCPLSFE